MLPKTVFASLLTFKISIAIKTGRGVVIKPLQFWDMGFSLVLQVNSWFYELVQTYHLSIQGF
jgi:hypothetical protein